MDKVRLGRALGYGARHAARTLSEVAEAAAAPDPRPPAREVSSSPVRPVQAAPRPQVQPPRRAQVRGAGGAIWRPLATYSGALWLRVTGLFFAVIALALGNGAWRLHGQVNFATPGSGPMQHFWVFLGFGLLFAYFAVSSFARANRRERRG